MASRLSDNEGERAAWAAAERLFAADLRALERNWKSQMKKNIEYISFAGGGTSALVSLCALCNAFDGDRAGYREWRARRLRGVSGTSFGSILACTISAGMDWQEAVECVVDALGPGLRIEDHIGSYVAGQRSSLVDERAAANVAAAICERAFMNRMVTFEEAFAASGVELVIVCCDIRTGANVELGRRTTPDMTLADAVRSSCAIPMLMPCWTPRLTSATLVDGGMINNFALVFEDVRRTLFLSTRFEGLAEPPGVITAGGMFEATKIMIDCQHFTMVRTGAVPPEHIVMCPRLFGFLSFPFDSREAVLDAFARECRTAIAAAFYRQWIHALVIACVLIRAIEPATQEDRRVFAERFAHK